MAIQLVRWGAVSTKHMVIRETVCPSDDLRSNRAQYVLTQFEPLCQLAQICLPDLRLLRSGVQQSVAAFQ